MYLNEGDLSLYSWEKAKRILKLYKWSPVPLFNIMFHLKIHITWFIRFPDYILEKYFNYSFDSFGNVKLRKTGFVKNDNNTRYNTC